MMYRDFKVIPQNRGRKALIFCDYETSNLISKHLQHFNFNSKIIRKSKDLHFNISDTNYGIVIFSLINASSVFDILEKTKISVVTIGVS